MCVCVCVSMTLCSGERSDCSEMKQIKEKLSPRLPFYISHRIHNLPSLSNYLPLHLIIPLQLLQLLQLSSVLKVKEETILRSDPEVEAVVVKGSSIPV